MKKNFVWFFGSLFFVVLSLNVYSVTCLFNISTETWNTDGNILHLKRLKNLKTGESALIHLYGGKIEALQLLNTENKLVDLLLGHNSNATAVIANTYWRGAILVPFANRIANGTYFWNGKKLYLKQNDVFGLKNALHGLLYHYTLEVTQEVATDKSAILKLAHTFHSDDEQGYPFDLSIELQYVFNDKGLWISVSATNVMQQYSLPFYHGAHPYFLCDTSKSYLILDPCSKWEIISVDSQLIPNGHTEISHLFNGTSPIGFNSSSGFPNYYDMEFRALASIPQCRTIRNKLILYPSQGGNPSTLILEQDSNFRFSHLFTGSFQDSGKDAIALEPMSGEANAYNNFVDLKILDPSETWEATFGFYLEK